MDEESFPRGGKRQQHIKFSDEDHEKGLFSEKANERFPRGGKKGKQAKHKKFTDDDDDDDDKLFEEAQGSPAKEKKGKKKQLPDSFPEVKEKQPREKKGISEQEYPHRLSSKDLYPGMLILGCVRDIRNYDMILALPNGLTGTVSLTQVGQAYTDALHKFSEAQALGHDPEDESVHTLSELFRVGSILPCKFLERKDEGKRSKVVLTVNPREVNQSIAADKLHNGMHLYGSVASVEDHGYTVDLGVKGVAAFLKTKDAENYIRQHNSGKDLMVGQCLKFKLLLQSQSKAGKGPNAGVNRVVNVTLDTGEAKTKGSDGLPYSCLVPGLKVQATVEKVLDEGLVLSQGSARGEIHVSHLANPPNTYTVGEEIGCKVLFVNPLSKTVVMTTLPHLMKNQTGRVTGFESVTRGQIFEEAKVTGDHNNRGLFMKLRKNLLGFEKMEKVAKKMKEDYKQGSVHRARVLDYQPLENVAIVSTQQNVLEQKYMKLDDVNPGDLVQCTITKISEKGVLVKVQKGMQAFIPAIHLADITLKHPEKKFKVDQKLKCRVLLVNLEKKSLTLTHKKSLLQSKLPQVSSYSQIERGHILEGYITSIKDFGVHVRFYGDVQGLVPRAELSTQPIPYPEKVFYRGQVVRCRVTQVDPAGERLKLSLVMDGKKEFGQKDADAPADFEIGKFVKCKVVEKTDKGLDVELLPSGKKAFLPKGHLSDSVELCEILLEGYRPGDTIDSVMYLSKTNVIIVTRKQAFTQVASDGQIVHEFDRLQPDLELPGSVKNVMQYGVFVQFPGQLFGLVPNHLALDKRVPDIGAVYHPGQSVVAKVVEVSAEKQRFLATLKMEDCYHADTDNSVQILDSFLSDRNLALKLLKKHDDSLKSMSKMKVGQVCKMTVVKVTDSGVVGDLDNGVKATAIKAHREGKLKKGGQVECVVLDIDPVHKCVEVSLQSRLVKELSKAASQSPADKVKRSLSAQAEVLLARRYYTLLKLKEPAAGQLVYLPNRRHWNDVLEHKRFHVGEVYLTLVERVNNDRVYVSLKAKNKTDKKDKVDNKADQKKTEKKPPHLSALDKALADWQPAVSSYDEVTVGQVLKGLVVKFSKKGIIVRVGHTVQGKVSYEGISKGHILVGGKTNLPLGTSVTVKVLQKSEEGEHNLELSMQEEDTGVKTKLPCLALKPIGAAEGSGEEDNDDDAENISQKKRRKRKGSETIDISEDASVSDKSSRKRKDSSEDSPSKSEKKKKKLSLSQDSSECMDDSLEGESLGIPVKTKRKKLDTETEDSDKKTPSKKRRKSELVIEDRDKDSDGVKKRRKSESDVDSGDISVAKKGLKRGEKKTKVRRRRDSTDDSDSGVEIKIRKSLDTQASERPVLEVSEGFSWVTDFTLPTTVDGGHPDSSDESDAEDTRPVKKSKQELRQQKLEEEKRLYELERQQLEGDQRPETADDFDRLVLQSPDSSMVWLRYMAFHLETAEVDKARAVAERALRTITFTEEQEKLNVWVAYLNLENMYGSPESLSAVLTRATQQCDSTKVNLQMVNIYQTSGKTEEAERLFNGLVKKQSGDKDLWFKFGQFYFDQSRPDSARKLLQRALKSLPTKFHVETISKFAQFEFKSGEPERGKTMYENILSTYPGRTDLWSVYIDMVTKLKDHDVTRALYNRLVNMKLGAKKMKFFFKKFLSFEEQHGSPEQVADIKKRALEYVEAQGYMDE